MLKLVTTLVSTFTLTLLIGVIHYEPPVGSNIEKVQQNKGHCPPGQHWSGGQCR
jgi:hypothetical protein